MKYLVIVFIFLFCTSSQKSNQTYSIQDVSEPIGKLIHGSATANSQFRSYHYLTIEELEKKYLFFKLTSLSSEEKPQMSLAVYELDTASLLLNCTHSTIDSCYLSKKSLHKNSYAVLMVECSQECNYALYSYWGNIEHLKPGSEMKFRFTPKDPTQLFHIDLKEKKFTQVRIVLKPQTERAALDSVKLYANKGLENAPTKQKHDFQSVHVWDDAEAILLSKDQVSGEEGINLFITGSAKTAYVLRCQLVEEEHHNIEVNENIYEYLQGEKSTFYHFSLNNSQVEEYAIIFSVFTGELQVGYYYDKEFKQPYARQPYQYMSDLQFFIDPSTLRENTKDMYIKVFCPDSSVTYMLNLQTRSKQIAHKVNENIYDFLKITNKSAVYFNDFIYTDEQQGEIQNMYSLSVLNVYQTVKIEVRACLSIEQEQQCVNISNPKYMELSEKIKIIGETDRGTKKLFKIEVAEKFFQFINNREKKATILVIFTNQEGDNSLIAFEYSSESKPKQLRDARVLQERVYAYQTKLYKYINNDPTIQSVQFQINQISGYVEFQGQRQDFRLLETEKLTKTDNNTIVVTKNITQPIFLSVYGNSNAIYTICVVVFHEEHPNSATVTMAEDVQYKVKLYQYEAINLQLNPIFQTVKFEYTAEGGPVVVCESDRNGRCDHSKTSDHNQLGDTNGIIEINTVKERFVNVKIFNYIQDRVVEVTAKFHSSDMAHCQDRKMNEIYDESIAQLKCLRFNLPVPSDIEINIVRSDLQESYQYFLLCDQMVQPEISKYRTFISQQKIYEVCKDKVDDAQLLLYTSSQQVDENSKIKVNYLITYTRDMVVLKDGIAYSHAMQSQEGFLQTFFYRVLNKQDTRILLKNKKGVQTFAAVIRKQSELNSYAEGGSILSQKDFHLNPSARISSEDIIDARCGSQCIIMIQVFSDEKIGTQVQYSIEVTQNHAVLNENKIRQSFLPKGSFDFYRYESKKNLSSIIVSVSDHNRHCAKIYMGNQEYPIVQGQQTFASTGNKLVYENATRKYYYIGVQALDNCPYSITVNQVNEKLTVLENGQLMDMTLKEGQKRFFIARHISNTSFKILSLEKYGSIKIYANQTVIDFLVLEGLKNGEDTYSESDFSIQNSYKNTLYFNKDDKNFCFDCYYLIMVKALSQTETSIFMTDGYKEIGLISRKTLFDQFHSVNESTLATFDQIKPGKMNIDVHVGKVEVHLNYKGKQFKYTIAKEKREKLNYNFSKLEGDFTPMEVKVIALGSPTFYTMEMIPEDQFSDTEVRVTPGNHHQISLGIGKKVCLKGYLKNKNEKILITTAPKQANKLKILKAKAELDGEQFKQLTKSRMGNILTFTFDIQDFYFGKAKPYSLCLNLNEKKTVQMTVIQEQDFNTLPPDTEIVVHESGSYALHPGHPLLLDLFECSGKSTIRYASNSRDVFGSPQKNVNKIGISGQPHAIKIEEFKDAMFLQVKGNLSTILWMPMIEEEDRGMGYSNYAIGKLSYTSEFNNIHFKIGGVKTSKRPKTQVKSIKYTLMISPSQSDLQEGVMCERFKPESVLHFVVTQNRDLGKSIAYDIDKQVISKNFNEVKESFYINVIAEMVLSVPDTNQEEYYKFIYYEQTVPAEILKQTDLQQKIGNLHEQMLLLVIVALVLLMLLGLCLGKWLIPLICHLRNRTLVEEAQKEHNDSIPVPPSSDRNPIDGENIVTEEKMN